MHEGKRPQKQIIAIALREAGKEKSNGAARKGKDTKHTKKKY